jgi:arabinofuranosyltransferase
MTDGLTRRNKIALLVLALATLVAVWYGWRLFWFLTDDAFIAFRYVSNSHLGFGYVWNAPPFRPVEGYTSFLWVVLLDVVWRLTGIEPPDYANYLSLIFTYMTLFVGALMVLKMSLRPELARFRVLFLGLVFLTVITNRTFLAWTSSGLETAMFNFFLTLWVYCCLFLPLNSRRWVFAMSLSVSLLSLSRPDGLLFALVTVVLIARTVYANVSSSKSAAARLALAASPLLIIPAHLLWRRVRYKAWLPNTYYAKTVAGRIWPQSGFRYFASFVLEYSLWILLVLLVIVILIKAKRFWSMKRLGPGWFTKAAVCFALFAHFLYYTIVIGGDHFEYRVYSHLVLLMSISFLWMLNSLRVSSKQALLLFSLWIVLSWPIPWIHWAITHNLSGRKTTYVLTKSVAKAIQRQFPSTPGFLLAYPRAFDRLQDWLINHLVCMRHQEHKNFYLYLQETLPSRKEGMQLSAAGYPVLTAKSVGVISWVLPKVNIIDILGLNDYVAARNPQLTYFIAMAHERTPPDGYLECFSPNVALNQDHFVITERPIALTAEKIVACEQQFAALVDNPEALKRTLPAIRNPIDEPHFFVDQQYRDMLNREPDRNGLEYWAKQLKPCPTGSYCFNDSRATMDMVFFAADEFQQTGFFIFRLYEASFGAAPGFIDFTAERKMLEDYRVNDLGDPVDVIPAQRSFLESWTRRAAFRAVYPDTMSAGEFVDHLFDKAQLKPSTQERKGHIDALNAGKSRAELLREVIETEEFKRRENERALVLMQFLLHLRRDVDYKDERYKAWLEKLDRHEPLDTRHVICLFLTSEEYQRRFGPAVTHNNADCP